MATGALAVERATYSVREVAARLGVGKDVIYDLIQRRDHPFTEEGPVRCIRLGGRLVVPRADLDAFLGLLDAPTANSGND